MATKVKLNLRTFKKDVTAAVFGHHKLNRAVDRHIKERIRPDVEAVVERYANAAIVNLKEIYSSGIDGADEDLNHIEIGDPLGNYHALSVRWAALSEEYAERKYSEDRGAGLFMLYKGKLARSVNQLASAKVSSTSRITKETRKTKGARKDITFRIDVDVASMKPPFDQLVRRPLILGPKAEDPEFLEMPGGPRDVAVYLERGALRVKRPSYQPPRPFVRKMALKLNELMRSEIYAIK